ncbi:MAG TPA: hypothetical protein VNU71_13640, partial [Burkholderiaceae bacterium]|nr:hypothetical protein [Burkholderiaceae bacterium]
LRSVLQDGGERHRESYRRRVKARALARGGQSQAATRLQQGRLGLLLVRWSTALYRWRLAAVSAAARGDALGRVLLGLGPTFHWSGLLGAALQLTVTWTLVALLLIGTTRSARGALIGPMTGTALVYVLFAGLTACRALHTTRREQALLALLPGLPAAPTLNRRLAARLLGGFFAWWLVGFAAALGLPPAGSTGQAWALTFSFASLPFAALLCRDWSALRAPSPFSGFAPLFGTALLAAPAIALQQFGGARLEVCCAVFAGAALALLAWRARRLGTWPGALPAGRTAYSGSSVK